MCFCVDTVSVNSSLYEQRFYFYIIFGHPSAGEDVDFLGLFCSLMYPLNLHIRHGVYVRI